MPPTGNPMLSEDYAEIGLGEEEGDYSTPAARNYELDRSQIQLNEIIGHGQFGDVHIGTCKVKQHGQLRTAKNGGNRSDDYSSPTTSLMDESTTSSNGGHQDDAVSKTNGNTGTINVAVKTCKADADITVSEKFLEEACECLIRIGSNTISYNSYFYTDIMQKFEHPHIIRLIGICGSTPIWIVMELAQLGELRAYLKTHSNK